TEPSQVPMGLDVFCDLRAAVFELDQNFRQLHLGNHPESAKSQINAASQMAEVLTDKLGNMLGELGVSPNWALSILKDAGLEDRKLQAELKGMLTGNTKNFLVPRGPNEVASIQIFMMYHLAVRASIAIEARNQSIEEQRGSSKVPVVQLGENSLDHLKELSVAFAAEKSSTIVAGMSASFCSYLGGPDPLRVYAGLAALSERSPSRPKIRYGELAKASYYKNPQDLQMGLDCLNERGLTSPSTSFFRRGEPIWEGWSARLSALGRAVMQVYPWSEILSEESARLAAEDMLRELTDK
ncbi:MAG: hypothetical protein KDD42_08675, partial [Bdellovibrionales bacterium]|nr:hypothetical protein [Bdellovibrionales bacterium]